MATPTPPTISPAAAARWAQSVPTASPWLHAEVARRMEARLQWMAKAPDSWLHWQPLRGGLAAHADLVQRYPQAAAWVWEPQPALLHAARARMQPAWWQWRRWMGAPTRFALPPQPVGMVWANMGLHMEADPWAVITQWHAALQTDGFLMFSCLGPDTLRELRAVYRAMGWPAPAHEMTDMHDWGDMLVQAGFAEPVMDVEHITLSYSSPARLLDDLRELGRNLHVARFAGLRGRAWRDALHAALLQWGAVDASGRLVLRFEVIYGHAFKPAPRVAVRPEARMSLADMRAQLQQGRARP